MQYTLWEERTSPCLEMEQERGRSTICVTGSRQRSKSCSDKDRGQEREDNLTRNSLSGLQSRSKSRSSLHKILTDKEDDDGLPMKQDSNDTGVSTLPTRLTRSQNPAFVAKQRSFLQKVTGSSSGNYSPVKSQNEEVEEEDDDEESSDSKLSLKRKRERSEGLADPLSVDEDSVQKTKTARLNNIPDVKPEKDKYCWTCHKEGVVLFCHTCPRSFHLRCAQMETVPCIAWMCPECATIMHAENVDTRSAAMKQLSLDRFCSLLKFALNRLKSLTGSEPFWRPVDQKEFSRYREFVVHPMDFSQLEYNIRRKAYGSTEAFIADVKWIVHDCIVFNTQHTKLTSSAKYILKVCKQEMAEIEICPDCYYNANTLKETWFIEACRKPHVLVWAKLKGYPYWPGKVLRVHDDNADVRFFGAHDRAWVNVQCCYLYSREMPAPVKSRKHELQICIKELEQHTKKLKERFGRFQLPPSLTPFDPTVDQLPLFLPYYKEEVIRMRRFKSRSRTFPGEDNGYMANNGDPLAISYELPGATHQAKPPKQKRSKTPSIDKERTTEGLNGLTADNSVGRASLVEWSKFEEEAAQIKLTESDLEDSETSIEVPPKRIKCERTVDNESAGYIINETSKPFGKSGIVDILQKKLMCLEPTSDTTESEVGSPATETQNPSDDSISQHRDHLHLQNAINSDGDSTSKVVTTEFEAKLKVSGTLCKGSDVEIISSVDNTAFSKKQKTDFLSSVNASNRSKSSKGLLTKEIATGTKGESSQLSENKLLQKETTKKESSSLDTAESNADGELLIKKYCNSMQEGVLCSESIDSELKVPENDSVCSNSLDSRDSGLDTERPSYSSETLKDPSIEENISKSNRASILSTDTNDEMTASSDRSLEENLKLPEKNVNTELVENEDLCTENSSDVISTPTPVKQFDHVIEVKTVTNEMSAELSAKESFHQDIDIADSVKQQTLQKCKDAEEKGLLRDKNFEQQHPFYNSVHIVDIAAKNDTVDSLNDTHSKRSDYSDDKLILLSVRDPIKVSSSKESEKHQSVLSIRVTTSDAVPEHGYSRRTTDEVTFTADKSGNKNVKSDTLMIGNCGEEGKVEEEKVSEENEVVVEEEGGGKVEEEEGGGGRKVEEEGGGAGKVEEEEEEEDEEQGGGKVEEKEHGGKKVEEEEQGGGEKVVEEEKQGGGGEKVEEEEERGEGGRGEEREKVEEEEEEEEEEQGGRAVEEEREKVEEEEQGGGGGEEAEEVEEDEEREDREEGGGGGGQNKTDEPLISSTKLFVGSSEDMKRSEAKQRENISANCQPPLYDNSTSKVDDITTSLESTASPKISVVKSVPEDHWKKLTDCHNDDSPDISLDHTVVKISANVRHSSEAQKETADLSVDNTVKNKISNVSVRPSGIRIRDVSVMCVKRKAREIATNTAFKIENTPDIEPAHGEKFPGEIHTSGYENSLETLTLYQAETEKSCVIVNQNTNMPLVSWSSASVICEEQKDSAGKNSASENVESTTPVEINAGTINNNKTRNKTVELVKATDDILLPFEMVCEHESDEETQSEYDMAEEGVTSQTGKALQALESTNVENEQLEQCTQRESQKSLPNRSTSDTNSDATTKNLNTCKTVRIGINYSKQASPLDIPGRATPASVTLLPNSRADNVQYNNIVENSMDDSLDAQHRNSPALGIDQSYLPSATSDAGPSTAEFHRHSEKIAQICCSTLEEILHEWSNSGDERATIKALQLEIEKINWQHKQEIAELRHNADLIASELRANLMTEHRRLMNEAKHRWEMEKKRAIEETKKKQWCSYCGKEAIFYCCWNTSYCDTNCQRKHWPQHVGACRHMSGNTVQEEASATSSVPQQTQVFAKPIISLQPQKSAHLLVPSVPLPTINRQPGVRYASYATVTRSPTILGTALQVVSSKPQQTATILSAPATSGNLFFTTARLSAPPPLNRVNSSSTTPAAVIYPGTYSQAGNKKTSKVTPSNFVNK